MIIFIDTCVYCGDYLFRGPQFNLLMDYIKIADVELVVSEIVLDELKNKYREQLSEKMEEIKKEINGLKRFSIESIGIDDTFIERNYSNYIKKLNAFLDIESVNSIGYPEISHKKVIERALSRRKPFSRKKDEYRDYLIWLSILKIAAEKNEEKICFITCNPLDFAAGSKENEKDKLHDDFINDLIENNIPSERFKFYTSLKHFLDEMVEPTFENIDQLKGELIVESELKRQLGNELEDLLLSSEIPNTILDISEDYEDPYIKSIENISNIVIKNYRLTKNNKIICELEADILCTIRALLFKQYYYDAIEYDDDIIIVDWEATGDDVLVEMPSVKFNVNTEFIYDKENDEIIILARDFFN